MPEQLLNPLLQNADGTLNEHFFEWLRLITQDYKLIAGPNWPHDNAGCYLKCNKCSDEFELSVTFIELMDHRNDHD